MFRGSVPAQMRAVVAETVKAWDVEDVYVGCSGNFTIERCLPGWRHHGNDVTLYSSALGWWAAGDDMPITLKDSSWHELGWLDPYMTDRDDLLATVMLATRFFMSVGRANRFHERNVAAHKAQWAELHGKTVAKVKASPLRLASYACKDVREWLDQDVPADGAIVTFPPFFAGDYEAMFAALDAHLDWPAPQYEFLDEAGKDAMIASITERPHWMIGIHQRRDELEPFLTGVVQTTNRGVPIYLYASDGPMRVVAPRQQVQHVMTSRLGPDDVLTGQERISLAPLTSGEFSTLRSQYMDPTIRPGSPLMALAVLADGKILGCIAFNPPDSKFDAHSAYLLSDFPAAPVRYRRLASLIVRCAQSTEAQTLLERSLSRRVNWIETTGFSNNPVSMKYRTGQMKLVKRSDATDGHHKHQLQYRAEAGRWTLQDAYDAWYADQSKHQTGDTQ